MAEEETIRFRGATYVAGAVVAQPGDATPTQERVGSRQVWVPPRGDAEYDLYLQLADGRFRGYRRRS